MNAQTQELPGRAAIVTGGAHGLGFAIASALAANGAEVLICGRSGDALASACRQLQEMNPNSRVIGQVADVSQAEGADAIFDAAMKAFGKLDILVNNAGRHGAIGRLGDVDLNEWVEALDLNLVAVARLCQKAVRLFETGGRGKIINISGGGATAPQFGLSAYAASKAGMVRLTETLAQEYRHRNIDVNALAPGALKTRLTEELANASPAAIGPEAHRKVLDMRAAGGTPLSKAADLSVYLASPASDGLTGRLISAVWDPWPFSREQIDAIMRSDIYTLRRIVPDDRQRG